MTNERVSDELLAAMLKRCTTQESRLILLELQEQRAAEPGDGGRRISGLIAPWAAAEHSWGPEARQGAASFANFVDAQTARCRCGAYEWNTNTSRITDSRGRNHYPDQCEGFSTNRQAEPSPVHSEEWLRIHRCPPDVECAHCNPVNRGEERG